MSAIESTFRRDANHVPITEPGFIESKAITYAAATTGATGAKTLFTVTGDVWARVYGVCSADLTSGGSATMEVGIVGATALIIAQTTATAIDTGEVWYDNTPVLVGTLPSWKIIPAGADIIQTIGTTTVTGGTLNYYCHWLPISDGASVVAA